MELLTAGHIEEGFVTGEDLEVRGDGLQGLHDAGRDPGIDLRAGRALDQLGALLKCLLEPHPGLNPKGPGFVARSNDARPG